MTIIKQLYTILYIIVGKSIFQEDYDIQYNIQV